MSNKSAKRFALLPRARTATWQHQRRCSAAMLGATLLAGCGKPAYPDEQAVRERVELEYRDVGCKLVRSERPKLQKALSNQPFLYVHIRFEARCKDLSGSEVPLLRQQLWQLNRERPTLFQGAWRWEPAGEISY